jgi:hypothetical protein
MADSKAPAKVSTVRVPVPPIPQIETPLPNEKVWEYQQRVQKVLANRGSRYPAFCIEPMPWERQRLHKPMTAEDRFLRKQWLLDQNLSPNEPRSVPASQPMFAARRILRMPWDTAEVMMAKVIVSIQVSFRWCLGHLHRQWGQVILINLTLKLARPPRHLIPTLHITYFGTGVLGP